MCLHRPFQIISCLSKRKKMLASGYKWYLYGALLHLLIVDVMGLAGWAFFLVATVMMQWWKSEQSYDCHLANFEAYLWRHIKPSAQCAKLNWTMRSEPVTVHKLFSAQFSLVTVHILLGAQLSLVIVHKLLSYSSLLLLCTHYLMYTSLLLLGTNYLVYNSLLFLCIKN